MASSIARQGFLPGGLRADRIEIYGDTIRIFARSVGIAATCPRCGVASRQVHSRYQRRPADLPAHGRAVELRLTVRRFRCRATLCPGKIFSERFPAAVAQRHARRTSRLQGLVRCLALALGGRPAEALGHRLLLPVSKDTFLRSLRSASENDAAAPRVIGIDD